MIRRRPWTLGVGAAPSPNRLDQSPLDRRQLPYVGSTLRENRAKIRVESSRTLAWLDRRQSSRSLQFVPCSAGDTYWTRLARKRYDERQRDGRRSRPIQLALSMQLWLIHSPCQSTEGWRGFRMLLQRTTLVKEMRFVSNAKNFTLRRQRVAPLLVPDSSAQPVIPMIIS